MELAKLEQAKKLRDQILAVSGPRTEANTLVPYNQMEICLDKLSSTASLLSETHPDKAVREKAELTEQEVQRFVTELSLNRDMYEAFLALDVVQLDKGAQRLVEKNIRDFKRSGVDKDEATRAKITAIEEELVLIGQDFGRNIREDIRQIEVEAKSLRALPKDYIDSHKPLANGKVVITTDCPDYVPFLTYSDDAEARRELWLKYMNRGYPKNESVLNRMVQKRHDLALLLGYESYAAFVVEDKMVKSVPIVADFIEKISDISKDGAHREYLQLLEEKAKSEPGAKEVFGFEKSYLEEKIKRREYNFDSQAVRPYFRFEKVRDGLLDLTAELFALQFNRVENAELWHPSVEAFDVYDGAQLFGRIYLDLHPRENKYKHAAQFTVQSGVLKVQNPEGALVCNFADPSLASPALMDHDQVVTFFHEFGHLMHHILGGHQKWVAFSGVATEWDFVEAPSQLFEEWAYDAQVLQRFAHHYETGEPIPEELVNRMRAADEFGKGVDSCQQMFYAALSLKLYSQDPSAFNAAALLRELQMKYSKFPYVEGTNFHLNFGHLDGYSAMYYTYMWSKVIAKDLALPFKKNGMMNKEVALRYRKLVLEPGGSKDADELVCDFLGRPYTFEAFKEWIG